MRTWHYLLGSIRRKKCIPVVGAGLSNPWIPLGKELGQQLVKEYDIPPDISYELSRITQFIAITAGHEFAPKEIVSKMIKRIQVPDFISRENNSSPLAILANLDVPIYLTTNYDHFIEALKQSGKEPVSEFFRWNENLIRFCREANIYSIFDKDSNYRPSSDKPLVYHLHGDMDYPNSIVLTDNDYLDFVTGIGKDVDNQNIPTRILLGFMSDNFLTLGYSLADITIRVLFKILRMGPGVVSIAIMQPDRPIQQSHHNEKRLKLISEYYRQMFNITVHFAYLDDFVNELKHRYYDHQSGFSSTPV